MVLAKTRSKSLRNIVFNEHSNDQMLQYLTLIADIREQDAKRDAHYKKQVAWYHNAKVKPSAIKEGDLLLRKNDVSMVDTNRKLDLTWEGP